MSRDFTLEMYALFCDTLKQLSCPTMTVKQFIEIGQPQDFIVVLRHDVDRSIASALRMARLEAKYGISATYYIRMTRNVFRPTEIRELSRLGHEVGYHYEVLAKAKGNAPLAIAMFEKELVEFRRIVPVETISMHGSPLTPWNNLELWKTYDYRDYGVSGEISSSIDYSKLYYFTDTGRSWDAGRYNLRDRVNSRSIQHRIHATRDLIGFLRETCDSPVFINAHPNRWAGKILEWCIGTVSDFFINQVKWLIARRLRNN